MRPSEDVIKHAEPIFGINTPLLVSCFEDLAAHAFVTPDGKPQEMPQNTTNVLFSVFLDGMMTVMSPGSRFNREFKMEAKADDGPPKIGD